MLSKRLARLVVDPALDLAMSDSVATFRLRIVLAVALAGMLGCVVSWPAAAWLAAVLGLEVEGDRALRARIADRRLRRGPRWGFLLRALTIAVAWEAGPALMMFSGDGRFFVAGVLWGAGTVLYASAVSFRAPAYAALAALPGLTLFAAAAVRAGERHGWAAGAMLGATSLLYSVFALNAALLNHGRERTLRRTRVKLAQEAEAVRRLAFNDQLTGLVNRRQLMQHLERALAQAYRSGEPVALLLIDLDRFKFVNDTYGHGGGDELLRAVAERLKHACRGGDGARGWAATSSSCSPPELRSAGRRGGRRSASWRARRARAAARASRACGGLHRGQPLPAGGTADRDLLREADLALYRVKENGRNGFVLLRDRRWTRRCATAGAWRRDLRAALEAGDSASSTSRSSRTAR